MLYDIFHRYKDRKLINAYEVLINYNIKFIYSIKSLLKPKITAPIYVYNSTFIKVNVKATDHTDRNPQTMFAEPG